MRKNLTLYKTEYCPFCRHVLDYLSEKDIHIPTKDTQTSSDSHKELIQIGGKPQVPCLVIDGQALYESTDIINWFEEHYS